MEIDELEKELAELTDQCFATKDLDEKIKLAQKIVELENEINRRVVN